MVAWEKILNISVLNKATAPVQLPAVSLASEGQQLKDFDVRESSSACRTWICSEAPKAQADHCLWSLWRWGGPWIQLEYWEVARCTCLNWFFIFTKWKIFFLWSFPPKALGRLGAIQYKPVQTKWVTLNQFFFCFGRLELCKPHLSLRPFKKAFPSL